jgi:hypothetical protein
MWTHGVPVDEQLKQQPLNTASMPFIYKWLAVMASSQVRNPGWFTKRQGAHRQTGKAATLRRWCLEIRIFLCAP